TGTKTDKPERNMSCLDAAAKALMAAKEPMNCQEMIKDGRRGLLVRPERADAARDALFRNTQGTEGQGRRGPVQEGRAREVPRPRAPDGHDWQSFGRPLVSRFLFSFVRWPP